MAQTLANWELLLVDDCSTDGSGGIAEGLAAGDARIRLIRKSEKTGVGATRNVGLRAARGRVVAYLDRDDEYSPQYFARLAGLDGKADVFVFGYDFVHDDEPNRPPEECRPHLFRNRLMTGNIVTPLGIAHRREWIDKAGAFNELVWIDEDTDLLKRLARGREVPLHRRRERTLPHPALQPEPHSQAHPTAGRGDPEQLALRPADLRRRAAGSEGQRDSPHRVCLAWRHAERARRTRRWDLVRNRIGLYRGSVFSNLSISCRLSVLSWGRNHLSGWLVKIIQGGEGRESRGGIAHHALRYGRCKRLLGFSGRRSFPGSAGSIPHRVTIAHHK